MSDDGMIDSIRLYTSPTCYLCGEPIWTERKDYTTCQYCSSDVKGTIVMVVCRECTRTCVEDAVGKKFASEFKHTSKLKEKEAVE